MGIWLAQVALPLPIWRPFDYLLPAEAAPESFLPGCRVLVPLGKRSLTAYLLGLHQADENTEISGMKPILALLDTTPLLEANDIQLLNWASQYYHYPLGQVLDTAFPVWFRNGKTALLPALKQPAFPQTSPPLTLNPEQVRAVSSIADHLDQFRVWLLEGVTGSGKTEVYLQLAEKILATGRQVLILVPEITLTPQLEQRVKQRFAEPIVVLHSALAEKRKAQSWLGAQRGDIRLVLGTRSAVWTPMKNLGLIIVDEEHDASFKQQEGFRYSARDMATRRAQQTGIPIVLGSATPSMETLYNVSQHRYSRLQLPQRAGSALQPSIRLIDIRGQRLNGGLSPVLIAQIKQTLDQHEQVLLFLNRRGYAPVLTCHSCGWIARCKHCDTNMVLHASDARLRCHHCCAEAIVPKTCPECLQPEIYPLGLGTERVEQTLSALFPQTTVLRIDRDTTRKKGSLERMLNTVHSGETRILLGTQMLAKGHHLPGVTLVGVLDIDGGFYSADFRAAEQTAQLLTQVAGRAGRGERPGNVMLQTRHPDHPLLQTLLSKGYGSFAEAELFLRQQAELPPYSYHALWRSEARDADKGLNWLQRLRNTGQTIDPGVMWWGPVPAPLKRVGDRYRAQLMLQSSQRHTLHRLVSNLIDLINTWPDTRKLRWSVDIDPQDLR